MTVATQEGAPIGQSESANSMDSEVAKPSVGQRLKAERERQGLTIADVAQRMKYAVRQIEAVEADDFETMPGLTVVRGFVRGYARLLGIEGDGLVRSLEQSKAFDNGPTTVQLQGVSGTRAQFPSGAGAHKAAWPWLLAILLAIALVGGFSVYHWQAPTDFLPQEVPKAAPQSPAQGASLPAGRIDADTPLRGSSLSVPMVESPKVGSAVVSTAGSESAAKPSQGRLRLVFGGESWTEVRDATGAVLMSRNNQAGSEQFADGDPPFNLVVGNATAVKLFYNGAEVDMEPYIKGSVARIHLK